ncbi:hypothetical protein B0H63DRAFT_550585 [Podospora didyma]|uniref:Uncharacterized protein n=1 Tax=Podospora didyma TaxID=330526 RepID=A0AAE0N6P0_9PEZI|nr:hypothetical protein B0H63DRAFT_550585 [Podospora didyma]
MDEQAERDLLLALYTSTQTAIDKDIQANVRAPQDQPHARGGAVRVRLGTSTRACGRPRPPGAESLVPAINIGYDVIAIAQTAARRPAPELPISNKLMDRRGGHDLATQNPASYRLGIGPLVRAEAPVVVVCPSRELAVQIFNEARKFC